MILTPDELTWIDGKLKTYQLKHGDFYNEILDHIISAIEKERGSGNRNNMECLFQHVVDVHFGGFEGIAKMVANQEHLYTQQIQNLWWQSLRYYITWPMIGFTTVVILISFRLPDFQLIKWLLLAGCLLLTGSSVVYAWFYLKGRLLESVGDRQLFLRRHLIKKVSTSFWIFNWLLCFLPAYAINYLPPIIFTAVLMMYIFLNLAAIRFCRQFKTISLTEI